MVELGRPMSLKDKGLVRGVFQSIANEETNMGVECNTLSSECFLGT